MEHVALHDKSDEKASQDRESFRLCSACRGDYEDPDATAEEEEEKTTQTKSFPRDAICSEDCAARDRGPERCSEEDGSMRRSRRVRSVRTFVPSQREVLRDVLLSATECGSWLTLRELAQLTQFGEASISAQLRHLRKAKYGSYVVEQRVRRGLVVSDVEHGAIWEYRLRRGIRVGAQRSWTSKALPCNAAAAMTAPSC
jgi:hypothetical protein